MPKADWLALNVHRAPLRQSRQCARGNSAHRLQSCAASGGAQGFQQHPLLLRLPAKHDFLIQDHVRSKLARLASRRDVFALNPFLARQRCQSCATTGKNTAQCGLANFLAVRQIIEQAQLVGLLFGGFARTKG